VTGSTPLRQNAQPLAPELVPPMSLLDRLPEGGVVGCDPSTQRLAFARLSPAGVEAITVSLRQGGVGWRLSGALSGCIAFMSEVGYDPRAFALEVPFAVMGGAKKGGRAPRVPVRQYEVQGVIKAAASRVWGLETDEVSPSSWKAAALGKGHGFAKPPEYVAWAQAVTPWRLDREHPEDEAAAIGVATWAALRLLNG
jgi:hypothetical protein